MPLSLCVPLPERVHQTVFSTRALSNVVPAACAVPVCVCARSELSLLEALQRRMEGVVLGLASGSYAQRVQVSAAAACWPAWVCLFT